MKRNDLILAAGVILAAAAVFAFQYFRQDGGDGLVKITVGGEIFGTYDLMEDQTIDIDDTNRLIIEEGSARMDWADCPDQVCVHHRAVSRKGESIICLPNQVVVSIESGRESGLDGIAQ